MPNSIVVAEVANEAKAADQRFQRFARCRRRLVTHATSDLPLIRRFCIRC